MNKFSTMAIAALLVGGHAFAQGTSISDKDAIPKNWQLLDKKTNGYPGISLDEAYSFVKAKNVKAGKIIVAVIDSGVDTLHEDLKPILWRNPKEIPGNGIDDDKNGYVDDIYGWNFLGGKDGRNVGKDSYEGARVYWNLKAKWDGKEVDESKLSADDKAEYAMFLRAKQATVGDVNPQEVAYLKQMVPRLKKADSVLRKELGKEEYNGNDVKDFTTQSPEAKTMKNFLVGISKANNNNFDITNKQILDEMDGELSKGDAVTTPPPAYRKDIVGDNENDINDRNYGNPDVMANTPFHGTHCSGIIAAVRNNGIGMDGVVSNAQIMMLRAVPDGDEHDKDIALAIRYAVDNGAKIISMSFGKGFSPEKKWVDDAYKYAESKGVLLVTAAGNDHKDVDENPSFPNANYLSGGKASNAIFVGASGNEKNGGYTASFSNYGKSNVDVFAPGVGIYSTIPGGNTYGNASGTSMACPLVAGVAAFVWQHYPTLTAKQVKEAIEKSVVSPGEKVNKPGTDEKVDMSELAKNGGIVNAYGAIQYAAKLAAGKKAPLPKSSLKKTSKS
ncbi:MAG: S8 family serine peptidase [Ferruginibacter sp.]